MSNLYWLSPSPTNWDKHYIQTADINASATAGGADSMQDTNAPTQRPFYQLEVELP